MSRKNRHFQENTKFESCTYAAIVLSKTFLIQNFDYRSKNGNINYVSALLSYEMHYLSIGQGLTLSPMENNQVFL